MKKYFDIVVACFVVTVIVTCFYVMARMAQIVSLLERIAGS